eukprot:jgi/Phyca11/18738/fgenesh1_pg.PHYCAscaffold_40_\
MGLDPKYCKVTVHSASVKASPPRMRRQTVGDEGLASLRNRPYKRAPPPVPPYKSYAAAVYDNVNEVLEDDTADIAVLSEDEPMPSSRRRAHTTSSMSTSSRLSNILNPLSRMTMRWTEQSNDAGSNKATGSSTTSASSTPDLMDTPPPLLTPPPMLDLTNSFLDVDTDGSDEITRPTLEDVASLMAGTPPIPAGLTLDMLPTEYETPPIPSHLRDVLLHNHNQQRSLSPLVLENSDDEGESDSEIDDDDTSSATTEDYGEDPTNHSVDIDSIRQTRDQAMVNFEASLLLRMQKMSKKLTFSNKIDVRAKFIITGVPDRTPVTSTSKFYLQSVYDRKKTVGFLPSRRDNHPGCLAIALARSKCQMPSSMEEEAIAANVHVLIPNVAAIAPCVSGHGGMVRPESREIRTMGLDIDSSFGWPIAMRPGGDCLNNKPDTNLQVIPYGQSKVEMRANDGANHIGPCTVYLVNPDDATDKLQVGQLNDSRATIRSPQK